MTDEKGNMLRLRDLSRGALLGTLIGDALGMTPRRIDKQKGRGKPPQPFGNYALKSISFP